MSARPRKMRPSVLTIHRRLRVQLLRDFTRHAEGRFVWNPSVRRALTETTEKMKQEAAE